MSEEKKPTMGPRRLFILLALGAGFFYVISSLDNSETEKAENTEPTINNTELASDNELLNVLEETETPKIIKPGNSTKDSKISSNGEDGKTMGYDPVKERKRKEYDPTKDREKNFVNNAGY